MSDVSLSKAVRSNLLSLQSTATMMSKTQDRLATGNKVNSALDNPTNFFTASSLNSRAGDLNSLMDGMANGIQTLEAADNGLTSITKTLESMQSTLRQARQDKSFQTASYTLDPAATGTISLKGGAIGDTAVDVNLTSATPASTTSGIAYKSLESKGLNGTSGSTAANAFGTIDVSTAKVLTIKRISSTSLLGKNSVTWSLSTFQKAVVSSYKAAYVKIAGTSKKPVRSAHASKLPLLT